MSLYLFCIASVSLYGSVKGASRYEASAVTGNYVRTRSSCQARGGDLATFDSTGDVGKIYDECDRVGHPGGGCYVGFNDIQVLNTWRWIDNTPFNGWDWVHSSGLEPGSRDRCGVVQMSWPRATPMEDYVCDNIPRYGICEYPEDICTCFSLDFITSFTQQFTGGVAQCYRYRFNGCDDYDTIRLGLGNNVYADCGFVLGEAWVPPSSIPQIRVPPGLNVQLADREYLCDSFSGRTTLAYDINYYDFEVTTTTSKITIDSCGSSYDTYLYFQTAGGANIASCDDCGDCGLQTILEVTDVAPGNYRIGVGGYSSNYGAYTINVYCGEDVPLEDQGIVLSGLEDGQLFSLCFRASMVRGTRSQGRIEVTDDVDNDLCAVRNGLPDFCPGPGSNNAEVSMFNNLEGVDTVETVSKEPVELMTLMWTAVISCIVSIVVVMTAYIVCIKPSHKTQVYDKLVLESSVEKDEI